jgi:sialate O-acetylesterase
MIAPLIPFAMRGVIWYQGESNASNTADALLYKHLFPTMIGDWRAQWGQGDFPFLFVQLANFRARYDQPTESDWALLREAQRNTLGMPATGMAVIIDAGEATQIHPKNKQAVGQRLALAALKVAYNKDVEWWGPLYDSMEKADGKIVLRFKHTAGRLVSKSPEGVKGFAIAGADKKFFWANAKIVGDTVEVSSPEVKEPVAVRYAWADNPEASLYNKEDLPASPFRTDAWEPGTTTAGVPAKPVVSEPVKMPTVLRPVRK